MKDSALLLQFTQGSQSAFAELVRRHVDLVFSAALRHVAGDRHLAEDIVQQVFIDLARKAPTLRNHPTLAGWLFACTRYTAINTLRREQRRTAREKQSEVMTTPASEPRWENIQPVIDEVLQELDEDDRQSVLMRFFGQQPFAAIANQLGISENAAQKRVDRALDRLSVALKRRGIASTAAALTVALGESCVAAPATLAGTVTTAALAHPAAATLGTFVVAHGMKIAVVAAAVGVVGWVGVQTSRPARVAQKRTPSLIAADAKPGPVEVKETPIGIEQGPTAFAPVPSETPEIIAPPPAPVRKIYVVNAGDTLKRIARAVGVTPEAIRAANPGYNFARMRVGELVQLPAGASLPTALASSPVPIPPDQLYIVQPGDTLLKIAQKRDLYPDELKTLNPGVNWQLLKVGQSIRAP
jgi:RNA polymerase sigma factor (sigma-70 family)